MRYARASIVDEQRFNTLTRFYPIFPYLQDSASVCRILPLQEAKCYKGSEKQVQLRCRQCGEKQGGIARRVVPMEAIRDAFFRFALVQEMAKIALMLIKMENEEHHKIELNVLNTFKKRKIKK